MLSPREWSAIMNEPTYNPNAIRELNETMKPKTKGGSIHSQKGWKKKKTIVIDKSAGKSALELIRESMKK